MAAITWDHLEERTTRRRQQPLQLVAPPSRRRPDAAVYRRRRLVALVLAVVLLAVGAQVASAVLPAGSASAGTTLAEPVVLVAEPGDSYWSLAGEVHQGGDLRSTVDALVDANGGHDLRPGDRIVLGS